MTVLKDITEYHPILPQEKTTKQINKYSYFKYNKKKIRKQINRFNFIMILARVVNHAKLVRLSDKQKSMYSHSLMLRHSYWWIYYVAKMYSFLCMFVAQDYLATPFSTSNLVIQTFIPPNLFIHWYHHSQFYSRFI